MSTLDIKREIKKFVIIGLIVLIFGIIYEHFSFGVYTIYMQYAFVIPFALGVIIYLLIYITKFRLKKLSSKLYNFSVVTITIGSLLKGALDIYGTSNSLLAWYIWISAILFVIAVIVQLFKTQP